MLKFIFSLRTRICVKKIKDFVNEDKNIDSLE